MPLLAYDLKLMRPGCVILQAALGGSVGHASRFPAESWLIAPTPDMMVYDIPDADLDKAVAFAHRKLAEGAYSRA